MLRTINNNRIYWYVGSDIDTSFNVISTHSFNFQYNESESFCYLDKNRSYESHF